MFDMVLTYKTKVENHFKMIKLDMCGEYVMFNDYCVNEYIIHEVTLP